MKLGIESVQIRLVVLLFRAKQLPTDKISPIKHIFKISVKVTFSSFGMKNQVAPWLSDDGVFEHEIRVYKLIWNLFEDEVFSLFATLQ